MNKTKLNNRIKSGFNGRRDGIIYEKELANFLLIDHSANDSKSTLNYLSLSKYDENINNSYLKGIDISLHKFSLSDKHNYKTTSKVDLSIICGPSNKKINFSIKKNPNGFQYHITSSSRFFEIIEKEFLYNKLNDNFKNAFNKFLGVQSYSPKELFEKNEITKNEFNKIEDKNRFAMNELSLKEQKYIKDFFSNHKNIIKLVEIFILGQYSYSIESVDFIGFNTFNFNETNNIVNPDFIKGKELVKYVKNKIKKDQLFVKFTNTTIHFGDIFSIQRKGSGNTQNYRSALQFKGKNLTKLKKYISEDLLLKEDNDLIESDSFKETTFLEKNNIVEYKPTPLYSKNKRSTFKFNDISNMESLVVKIKDINVKPTEQLSTGNIDKTKKIINQKNSINLKTINQIINKQNISKFKNMYIQKIKKLIDIDKSKQVLNKQNFDKIISINVDNFNKIVVPYINKFKQVLKKQNFNKFISINVDKVKEITNKDNFNKLANIYTNKVKKIINRDNIKKIKEYFTSFKNI